MSNELPGFIQGFILAGSAVLLGGQTRLAGASSAANQASGVRLAQEWDKTFPKTESVDHQKVTFRNRYGTILAAELFLPKNRGGKLKI